MKNLGKVCPGCGKTFIPRSKRTKYCSRECAGRAGGEERKRRKLEKVCACCGKPIPPESGNRKYCSAECQKKMQLEQNQSWKGKTTNICQYCGHEFLTRNPNQKYCCHTCSNKAQEGIPKRKPEKNENREPCRIVIPSPLGGVKEEMQPKLGRIYDAVICRSEEVNSKHTTVIIPEIGKLGLIVKEGEYKIVG